MDLGFSVLDRVGINPKYAVGREGWRTIKCASKRAYGCGSTGNTAVQDLDLILHECDLENLSSYLSVRAGDDVFRWIDQAIAEKGGMPEIPGKDRYFRSKVEIVDKGLIVVTLSFSQYGGFDYYLVFDSFDRSLSLIPYIPYWATCYTKCPLPLRHDGGYSLVLFGGEVGSGRDALNKFLWQWSPLAGPTGGSSNPWQNKKLRLPTEMKGHRFYPSALFSCNGSAFWADLALGTLCCKISALLEAYLVEFTFIALPQDCQLNRDEDPWPVEVYRTMGYVGGSVKFVAVDKPDVPRGRRVKVWTLEDRQWNLYSDIRLKTLRKDFKRVGLPKNLPMLPMLREQEGATLYFILAEETQTRDGGHKHHICRLDMPTLSNLQSKLLAHTSLIYGPAILPSDFFKYLDPLPASLGPISMEV